MANFIKDRQKSILITGCSSGIGHDAATRLHDRGWRVFATCRNPADCNNFIKAGIESVPLDYENESSIEQAVSEILERTGGTIDAVFNNGAYAVPGAVEDLPRDALRAIFEANLFGYHDLVRRVIPVMRAQGHGRIVQNSSVLGFVTLPWRGAYNATKHALEGLTSTMRLELRGTQIHVVLIEPGPITTMLRQKSCTWFEKWIDWEKSAHREFYERVLIPRLFAKDVPKDPHELPPEAVTRKLIRALEDPNPNPRYYVTYPTYLAGLGKRLLPTRMLDHLLYKS